MTRQVGDAFLQPPRIGVSWFSNNHSPVRLMARDDSYRYFSIPTGSSLTGGSIGEAV